MRETGGKKETELEPESQNYQKKNIKFKNIKEETFKYVNQFFKWNKNISKEKWCKNRLIIHLFAFTLFILINSFQRYS